MKNTIKIATIGCSLFLAAPAYAELESEIHAGYHGMYEFRGVDFGDDLYEAGVDLSYELCAGLSLSGGAWWAQSATEDELDLYIGLTKTIGLVDISVGHTTYWFPGDVSKGTSATADSNEVYIGASTELWESIGLSLTYFYDYDAIEAGYLEGEISRSFELPLPVNLDVSAGAAWSMDYNPQTTAAGGGSLSGFNHWFVSAAFPWQIIDDVTLTPYFKYVGGGSDLNNAQSIDASEDLYYGGVTLSVAF